MDLRERNHESDIGVDREREKEKNVDSSEGYFQKERETHTQRWSGQEKWIYK